MICKFFCKAKTVKTRSSLKGEGGNIFFTLFGAVAIVGVLGAGIMTTMRGPLSTMVEVQRRSQAEAEMNIAAKLILLESLESLTNGGDCDSDNFVEPLEFNDSAPAPTGGGQLPSSIAAAKLDPWGIEYGYCAWDAGPTIDDAGCDDDTSATYERLDGTGDADETYTVIAIVSAGPDLTFNTTCTGGASPSVTKSAGSDDIITSFTYQGAAANTGGLWNIKSGDPDTAEIGKNIEALGATFTDALDLTTSATAQLRLGAASMLLPTNATLSTCNGANDLLLRVNEGVDPPELEICDGDNTTWEAAVSSGIWTQAGAEIYYNEVGGNVGIGNSNPAYLLDVTGTLNADGAVTMGSTLNTTGTITGGAALDITGISRLRGVLDVLGTSTLHEATVINSVADPPLTVQNNGSEVLQVEADGQVAIGGGNADHTLSVAGDAYIKKNIHTENNHGVFWDDGSVNITGTSASNEIKLGAGTVGMTKDAEVSENLSVGGTLGVTGESTFSDTLNITVGNLGVTGCADEQILKYETTGSVWKCGADAGSGSGSGGGQTLEETLTEGDDGGALDITNVDNVEVNVKVTSDKVAADNYCNEADGDCHTYDELRDADQIQGTNIDANIVADTTTTGQILIWNQTSSDWEVGDGSDLSGVSASDITLPLDVQGEDDILEFNAAGRTFFRHLDTDDVLAIGLDAGASLTDGDGAVNNIFIGTSAGTSVTTGSVNIFMGFKSGNANDAGSSNVFIGASAGALNDSGSSNVFLGRNAGSFNTNGSANVFLGVGAGDNNTTGANNILIGNGIDNLTATRTGFLSIGNAIYGDIGTATVGSRDALIEIDGDLNVVDIDSEGRVDAAAHTNNVGLNLPTNAGVPAAVTGTAEGDIVYDSTNDDLYIYDGAAFSQIGGSSSVWTTVGSGIHYSSGNVGINVTNPLNRIHAVDGTVAELKFNSGLSALTPTIAIGNTSVSGKFGGLIAGTGGSAFIYDQTGVFVIGKEAKTEYTSGTLGAPTSVIRINTDGYMAIGEGFTTPNAMIHVRSNAATNRTSIFQAAASQSVNMTEWQNSAGSVIASVDQDGNFSTVDLSAVDVASSGRVDTAAHANNVGLNIPTNAGVPTAVTGTAEGDVVYDTSNDDFYIYDGSAFTEVGGGGGGLTFPVDMTGVSVLFEHDTDSENFLTHDDTNDILTLGKNAGGSSLGAATGSVLIGDKAGQSITTAAGTTAVGYEAGRSLITGANNTYLGAYAGKLDTGIGNTFLGHQAGDASTTGNLNTFLGLNTGRINTDGRRNIMIGVGADKIGGATTNDELNIGNAFYGDMGTSTATGSGDADLTIDGDLTVTDLTVSGNISGIFPLDVTSVTEILKQKSANKRILTYFDAASSLALGEDAGKNHVASALAGTWIGNRAGENVSSGNNNTFVGNRAGRTMTTGGNNTFVGTLAGDVARGSNNVLVGFQAGDSFTTGAGNTYIGHQAGENSTGSSSNSIMIGFKAKKTSAAASSEINIGNAIYGSLGNPVTKNTKNASIAIDGALSVGKGSTPSYILEVFAASDTDIFSLQDSDGTCLHNPEAGSVTVSCSSDRRLKTDIKDSVGALDYLNDFRVRDYTVKASGSHMTGVIAQEVQEHYPDLVKTNENTDILMVDQPNPWVLVRALQELRAENQDLKTNIAALELHNKQTDQTLASLNKQVELLNKYALHKTVGHARYTPWMMIFMAGFAGLLIGGVFVARKER